MYRIIFTILLFFSLLTSYSQDTDSKIIFLEDSVKVGMPVELALSVRYNKAFDILVPDSTYDFTPFEYVSKRYFNTVTTNNESLDSVIYSLRSFELDTLLPLSLKLIEVYDGDSLEISTNIDTILNKFIVSQVPDSINRLFLRETTDYYRVPKDFNYPYFIAGSGLFIIVSIVFWLVFGARIKRYFVIRRLNKQYMEYQKSFDKSLHDLNLENRFEQTERLLVLWKNYMEKLENIPYSKLTTKEISELKEDHLNKILEKLDKVIYSKKSTEIDERSLEDLRHYSSEAFSDKLNKVKHGIPN